MIGNAEKKKVAVLGGTGFIGRCVLRALAAEPDLELFWMKRVDAVTPDIPNLPQPMLIEDLEAIDISWLSDAHVIIDLVSRGRGRMIQQRDINLRIRPHLQLIDGLINHGSQAHYIFLSSGGAVYGRTEDKLLTESSPCLPTTEYGIEKAIIEMYLLSAAQSSLEVSILRVTNAYGRGQIMKPGFGVIPTLVSALETGSVFRIFGSGEMQRDYVNVIDVQRAIEAAIRVGGVGTVNIGTGQGTSINELVTLVQDLSARPLNTEYVETTDDEPDFAQLDISYAKDVLNWEPTISLRRGLGQILEEI